MKKLKVHTVEFTKILDYNLYRKLRDFLFNGTERCYAKDNKVKYEGFASRGIRLELMRYTTKEFPNSLQFKIKYIFTPSRFINSNDYLGLTDITELSEITNKISRNVTECVSRVGEIFGMCQKRKTNSIGTFFWRAIRV